MQSRRKSDKDRQKERKTEVDRKQQTKTKYDKQDRQTDRQTNSQGDIYKAREGERGGREDGMAASNNEEMFESNMSPHEIRADDIRHRI